MTTAIAPGKRGGYFPSISADEIAARYTLVHDFKEAVGGRELTLAELDSLLAPIDCRRTRLRLAKLYVDGNGQRIEAPQ